MPIPYSRRFINPVVPPPTPAVPCAWSCSQPVLRAAGKAKPMQSEEIPANKGINIIKAVKCSHPQNCGTSHGSYGRESCMSVMKDQQLSRVGISHKTPGKVGQANCKSTVWNKISKLHTLETTIPRLLPPNLAKCWTTHRSQSSILI